MTGFPNAALSFSLSFSLLARCRLSRLRHRVQFIRRGHPEQDDRQRARSENAAGPRRQAGQGLQDFHFQVRHRRPPGQQLHPARTPASRQQNRRQRADRHGFQKPPADRRSPQAQCAGPRSGRHPHPLAALARKPATGTHTAGRIYIHGTPEECRLGTPASYGCIRMGSRMWWISTTGSAMAPMSS